MSFDVVQYRSRRWWQFWKPRVIPVNYFNEGDIVSIPDTPEVVRVEIDGHGRPVFRRVS